MKIKHKNVFFIKKLFIFNKWRKRENKKKGK